MDGPTYERWVAGFDVETGKPKGRLRTDDQAVRFVEVVVNGPKTWSLVAALHPEIAAAYDAAQEASAARQIVGWLAGACHYPDRTEWPSGPGPGRGDSGRRRAALHLPRRRSAPAPPPAGQRPGAGGRDVAGPAHTVGGARQPLDAINGIGHAAVITNPRFRAALADPRC